jgi:hypothetical protein
MSQFFGQNYLKAQYFNSAYLHGAARSGYWRLFFYQMQEEALKQYEENTGKKVKKQDKPVEVVAETVPVVKTKRKKIVERIEEPKLPPLKLNPVVASPTAYDQLAELPPWVFNAIIEQTNVIDLDYHRNKRRQRTRRRAAAFLLMAA